MDRVDVGGHTFSGYRKRRKSVGFSASIEQYIVQGGIVM